MMPAARLVVLAESWRLVKIVSGGQTGADQAGWRAAEQLVYATGGVMASQARTETGPRPDLAARYHAIVDDKIGYAERTLCNVRLADGTIVFGGVVSPGSMRTWKACKLYRKPRLIITDAEMLGKGDSPVDFYIDAVRLFVVQHRVAVLNVAGNRESKRVGIGALVEAFLLEALAKP